MFIAYLLSRVSRTAQKILDRTLHAPTAPSQRLNIPLELVEAHIVQLSQLVLIPNLRRPVVLRWWWATLPASTPAETTAHAHVAEHCRVEATEWVTPLTLSGIVEI